MLSLKLISLSDSLTSSVSRRCPIHLMGISIPEKSCFKPDCKEIEILKLNITF